MIEYYLFRRELPPIHDNVVLHFYDCGSPNKRAYREETLVLTYVDTKTPHTTIHIFVTLVSTKSDNNI